MKTQTKDLMSMIDSLPIDLKTKLVEKLLSSLHQTKEEIDKFWAVEVEKRVAEIESGKVKMIAAEAVFEEVKNKYGK